MPDESRKRAVWMHAELEEALRRVGGQELLDDARSEARWYADLYHPLNTERGADSNIGEHPGTLGETGDATSAMNSEREPIGRLHARLEVLSRRLELANEDVAEPG